jgi:hypothetical protein
MQREQRLVEAEVAQQGSAVPRVLAGDGVDDRQHVQGAQAQVGEVADGRRDDVQGRRGILLGAGRHLRRRQELRSIHHLRRPSVHGLR